LRSGNVVQPHTLSPQARRNLPSALRNPLERRCSAIPARGPLEFLDCRRRSQAHQGLTDGAVDVTGAGVRVSGAPAQAAPVQQSRSSARPPATSRHGLLRFDGIRRTTVCAACSSASRMTLLFNRLVHRAKQPASLAIAPRGLARRRSSRYRRAIPAEKSDRGDGILGQT
jgi:hypothetical protein